MVTFTFDVLVADSQPLVNARRFVSRVTVSVPDRGDAEVDAWSLACNLATMRGGMALASDLVSVSI